MGKRETDERVRFYGESDIGGLLAELDAVRAERDEARKAAEEREGDMHARIRAGYDRTIADAWRANVAEVTARAERAEAGLAALRERAQRVRLWIDEGRDADGYEAVRALDAAIADTAQAAEAYRARVRAEALREAVGLRGVAPRSRGRRARWAVTPMTPEHARAIVADAIASSDDGTLSGPDLLRAAPVLIAEFDRLIAASAAVVAAWDDDEIGRVDGALIDALRGAR